MIERLSLVGQRHRGDLRQGFHLIYYTERRAQAARCACSGTFGFGSVALGFNGRAFDSRLASSVAVHPPTFLASKWIPRKRLDGFALSARKIHGLDRNAPIRKVTRDIHIGSSSLAQILASVPPQS